MWKMRNFMYLFFKAISVFNGFHFSTCAKYIKGESSKAYSSFGVASLILAYLTLRPPRSASDHIWRSFIVRWIGHLRGAGKFNLSTLGCFVYLGQEAWHPRRMALSAHIRLGKNTILSHTSSVFSSSLGIFFDFVIEPWYSEADSDFNCADHWGRAIKWTCVYWPIDWFRISYFIL